MKTIVTHISVDLDATSSAWLIKRYLPGWNEAVMVFVPAGTTWNEMQPDIDPNIIHVDTGLGKFDHHHIEDRTLCAAKLVYRYLVTQGLISDDDQKALERLLGYIVIDDNFGDVFFPEPDADRYDLGLNRLVDGFKRSLKTDQARCDTLFLLLDSALQIFKMKVRAEGEIQQGYSFESAFGKTLCIESENESVIKLALKKGFELVILHNAKDNSYRIKTLPSPKYDLSRLYDAIKKLDQKATWFLHISKNMLLNGSSKRPDSVPSALPLKKVIEITKSIA